MGFAKKIPAYRRTESRHLDRVYGTTEYFESGPDFEYTWRSAVIDHSGIKPRIRWYPRPRCNLQWWGDDIFVFCYIELVAVPSWDQYIVFGTHYESYIGPNEIDVTTRRPRGFDCEIENTFSTTSH